MGWDSPTPPPSPVIDYPPPVNFDFPNKEFFEVKLKPGKYLEDETYQQGDFISMIFFHSLSTKILVLHFLFISQLSNIIAVGPN
jgi:hypothetical protein